jgi:hypothetical protein
MSDGVSLALIGLCLPFGHMFTPWLIMRLRLPHPDPVVQDIEYVLWGDPVNQGKFPEFQEGVALIVIPDTGYFLRR